MIEMTFKTRAPPLIWPSWIGAAGDPTGCGSGEGTAIPGSFFVFDANGSPSGDGNTPGFAVGDCRPNGLAMSQGHATGCCAPTGRMVATDFSRRYSDE